jgi:hypothetical protein
MGDWELWGGCSCDCGGGQHVRNRVIKVHATKGGLPCPPGPMTEVGACNTQPCGKTCINGTWADWGAWTPCTLTCKGGVMWRKRGIAQEANGCGYPPVGKFRQVASCNAEVEFVPDVNCTFSDWADWSGCTEICNGIIRRARAIAQPARGGGRVCSGALKVVEPCNPRQGELAPVECRDPPPQDCVMENWLNWGACSTTCGVGQETRTRAVKTYSMNGGKPCPSNLTETQGCNLGPCTVPCAPVNCSYAEWDTWGSCDKCGGIARRFRHILTMHSCGGETCKLERTEEIKKCPYRCHKETFCIWNPWGEWGQCSKTCGSSGTRGRQRTLGITTDKSKISNPLLDLLMKLVLRADGTSNTKEFGWWEPNWPDLQEKDSVESLRSSLQDLQRREHDMNNRHLQELVVSFGCGIGFVVVAGALIMNFVRSASHAGRSESAAALRLESFE